MNDGCSGRTHCLLPSFRKAFTLDCAAAAAAADAAAALRQLHLWPWLLLLLLLLLRLPHAWNFRAVLPKTDDSTSRRNQYMCVVHCHLNSVFLSARAARALKVNLYFLPASAPGKKI